MPSATFNAHCHSCTVLKINGIVQAPARYIRDMATQYQGLQCNQSRLALPQRRWQLRSAQGRNFFHPAPVVRRATLSGAGRCTPMFRPSASLQVRRVMSLPPCPYTTYSLLSSTDVEAQVAQKFTCAQNEHPRAGHICRRPSSTSSSCSPPSAAAGCHSGAHLRLRLASVCLGGLSCVQGVLPAGGATHPASEAGHCPSGTL